MDNRMAIHPCAAALLVLAAACSNERGSASRPLLTPHRDAILSERLDAGYVRVSSAALVSDDVARLWPPSEGWHVFGAVIDAADSNKVELRLVSSKDSRVVAQISLSPYPAKNAVVVATRLEVADTSSTLVVHVYDGTQAGAPLLSTLSHSLAAGEAGSSQMDVHDRWSDGPGFRVSLSHQPLAAFSWNGPGSARLASSRRNGVGNDSIETTAGMDQELLRLATNEWPNATLELQAAAAQ